MNTSPTNSKSSNQQTEHDTTRWLLLAVAEAEMALRKIGTMLSGIDRGFDLWSDIHAKERWICLVASILPADFIRCYKIDKLARKQHSFSWFELANECKELLDRSESGETLAYTKLDAMEFEKFLNQSVMRLAKGLNDDDANVRKNTVWLIGHFPTRAAITMLQNLQTQNQDNEMASIVDAALRRVEDALDGETI